LSVYSVDSSGIWDTSSQSGHTSGAGTTTRRKDVANGDILDQSWVKFDFLIGSTQNMCEDFLWTGVLEAALLALQARPTTHISTVSRDDQDMNTTFVIAERTAETITTSLSLF
jgi:hypothetical protein